MSSKMTSQVLNTGSSVTYVAGNPAYNPPLNPPPYEAQPGIPRPPPATIVVQPGLGQTIIYQPQVGSQPTVIRCRSCNIEMVSKTQYKPSLRTHMFALILCVFFCWPCVCVPYCIDTCNNVEHYCTNCNAYIGTYQH